MRRLHRPLIALLVLFSLSLVILIIKPNQTGLTVYEGQDNLKYPNLTKIWDFSNQEEYLYNSSEISLENNKASLKTIVTTTFWYETTNSEYSIISALYNPEDKTSSVNKNDNKYITAQANSILNILLENSLENWDEIELYLNSGSPTEITLCKTSILCDSPGYGSFSFNGTEGVYNVTITNLDTPTNSFNIRSGELKIDYISSNKGGITKALFNPSDQAAKVNTKDGTVFQVSKDKLFDIRFNNSIENNDTVAMYLKSGSASELYLCDASKECTSPGYGKTSYDGGEGWYNITISNINTDMFNLDPENVRIDLIKAIHQIKNEKSSTNTSYKTNAAIKTKEITNIKQIKSIAFLEELNNQSIAYLYSGDKGLTWHSIPNNVSELKVQEIIFSAILLSDGKSTPILKSIAMAYDKIQPKVYFEIEKSGLVNLSSSEAITINSSGLLLNITVNEDVTNSNISVREFTNSSMNILKPLRSFMDIKIDGNLKISLNRSMAEIQYSDNDISSNNINESTLKIYYYNESNNTWVPLSSEVDLASNVVKAALPHFSIYGVFGSEINNDTIQSIPNPTPSDQSQSNQEETKTEESSNTPSSTEVANEIKKSVESITPKQEEVSIPEIEEPSKLNEVIDKENNVSNITKEEGITGFITKEKGIGVGS